MRQVNWKRWGRRTWLFVAVCALCLQVSSTDALAQGRRSLPPEKQAAAEELQAMSVAKRLDLSKEATEQLVAAYKAARDSERKAAEAIWSSEEGDRASRFEKYRQLLDSERGKLESALQGFLTKEQVEKAMASLGTFSWQWDRYVDTLAGFGLDEEKLDKALEQVNTYITDSSKATREASAERDWAAQRTILQQHKAKLDTALASILSEEQLAQWTEATASRRR